MNTQFVYAVEDLATMLSMKLPEEIYDNLADDELEDIQEELAKYGESFVFADLIASVSGRNADNILTAFQVVRFIPKGYIVFRHTLHGIEPLHFDSVEEVFAELNDFANYVRGMSYEQSVELNELVGNLK